MIHLSRDWSLKRMPMQGTQQNPTLLKVIYRFGYACFAALIVLLLSPLLSAFGLVYDIPQLMPLAFGSETAASSLLIVSVPLAWALGLAGMVLEWLTRYRLMRKRKPKRKRSVFSGNRDWTDRSLCRLELSAERLAARRLELVEGVCSTIQDHNETSTGILNRADV